MKAIKCIVSVILGILVATWSACAPAKRPASPPSVSPAEPASTQPAVPETQPPKEKDLPIRHPILE